MLKKFGFWKIYGIVVGIALAVIVVLLVLAGKEIDRYDRALPEHIADSVIEEFKNGSVVIDYPVMQVSKYDAATNDIFANYREKIGQVKEWSYKVNSGITSTTEMIYGIFGDGELMAYLKLENKHSDTALGMLAVNDWERKGITPVAQLSTYVLTVDIPEGFSAKANGVHLSAEDKDIKVSYKNGNVIYEIADLFKLPQVEVVDRQGKECELSSENGYVSANNVIYFSMMLPDTVKVSDQGMKIEGSPAEDNQKKYLFGTLNESIELTDALGQKISYSKSDELIFKNVTVTIPENFVISLGENDLQKYYKEKVANRAYKYILELNKTIGEGAVSVPDNMVYEFTDLLVQPAFEIKNNFGEVCEYSYEKGKILIENQAHYTSIPSEYKDLKAKNMAFTWTEYSQGGLGSDDNAFNEVAKLLIKDSYLYNAAYITLKNGDIKRVAGHTTVVLENKVKEVVVFSENLISCKVYIKKHFKFPAYIGVPAHESIDESSDTYYFYKLNGEWKLVDVNASVDNGISDVKGSSK